MGYKPVINILSGGGCQPLTTNSKFDRLPSFFFISRVFTELLKVEIPSASLTLLIIYPLGSIPVFLSVLKTVKNESRKS